jgi:hypothetical protein
VQVSWQGSSTGTEAGRQLYRQAQVGTFKVTVGDTVLLPNLEEGDEESDAEPAAEEVPELAAMGIVQCMWQDDKGKKWVQVKYVQGFWNVLL